MSGAQHDELSALLRWIAGMGAVTAEALALHQGISLGSARGRLASAERRGLLARSRRLRDRPALLCITRAGLRACGLRGLEPMRVGAATAEHAVACAAVAVALEARYPTHRVLGEPQLRRLERESAHHASAAVGRRGDGSPALHRPDLALWPRQPGMRPTAVEVELTVKAPRRLESICRGWSRCANVAGVIYAAAPEVEGPLERAIARAMASEAIVVVALASLLDELEAGAPAGAGGADGGGLSRG